MSTIFYWIVGIVAATVLFAGVPSAAALSGTLLSTVGGTAGSIVSGVPNMVTSFREGMGAGDPNGQSSLFAPVKDKKVQRKAPATNTGQAR